MRSAESQSRLLEDLIAIAIDAGSAAMEVYRSDFAVERKSDSSPVTEADRRADAIIVERLARIAGSIPALSEESADSWRTPDDALKEFFLVDPLDGTREFLSRNGEFTVNIALVRDTRPILGVVHAPAVGRLYAAAPGIPAFRVAVSEAGQLSGRELIRARPVPARRLTAVASRSHRSAETDDFLASLDVAAFDASGSSLKFCRVAEGSADVYPRFGRTMEWDTAAGQAVLEAAGGRVVVHPGGDSLAYGKSERGFDNPNFIAWGAVPA